MEIYEIVPESEAFALPWFSFEYTVDGRAPIPCRFTAMSLEAGKERARAILARMSREYTGRLPPGRYAKNNTISMVNNRRRKGKR